MRSSKKVVSDKYAFGTNFSFSYSHSSIRSPKDQSGSTKRRCSEKQSIHPEAVDVSDRSLLNALERGPDSIFYGMFEKEEESRQLKPAESIGECSLRRERMNPVNCQTSDSVRWAKSLFQVDEPV